MGILRETHGSHMGTMFGDPEDMLGSMWGVTVEVIWRVPREQVGTMWGSVGGSSKDHVCCHVEGSWGLYGGHVGGI